MPNHIKNKIELSGGQDQIEKLKSHMIGFPYEGTPDEKSFFDFNKIVEMPSELNIVSDGWIGLIENSFMENQTLKSMLDKVKEKANFEYDDQLNDSIDNLCKGIKNYLKHGHATWYGWASDFWNTKWNAYEVEDWEGDSIKFETAWSNVGVLIEKLSKMFPLVKINYKYSDEDTSCNCGIASYEDGEIEFKKLENQSKEAYDLYFELRPEDKKYYDFIDGKWEYVDED